jgi:hypothetical protein
MRTLNKLINFGAQISTWYILLTAFQRQMYQVEICPLYRESIAKKGKTMANLD